MDITLKTYHRAHDLASEGNWAEAAALLTPESDWDKITSEAVGNEILTTIFYTLLATGDLESAAALTWSRNQFSLRAKSAKRIWELYDSERMLLVMGGGSVGKSYTLSGRGLLDWARDPEHTLFRVISVTSGHAKLNIFAQMQELHKRSLIALPGVVGAEKITCDPSNDIAGIHLIAIPQGDQGKGRIRGIHPKPRQKIHPVFGGLSRTRVLLDECEEIPSAIWEDLANALLTLEEGDNDRIKIMGASNPKNASSEFGKRCEPQGGFNHESDEDEWTSKRGWKIYRIDGAKTENVMERRVVPGCEGLMTYEGFHTAVRNAGGEGTSEYYTMCRGTFPPKGHASAIISRLLLDRYRGDWIFEGETKDIYSVDSALGGGDNTSITHTRIGMARKLRHMNGKIIEVHEKPRLVIQYDHQVTLDLKADSTAVARAILRELPANLDPDWLAVDATGSADGCAAILADELGDILRIVYSSSASDQPVLAEDDELAIDQFVNVRAEMWYSFAAFLDAGFIAIGTGCEEELLGELSGLRGEQTGRKKKVEKKQVYKKRSRSKSPDRGDSAVQIVHLVRMRGDEVIGLLGSHKKYTSVEDVVFSQEVDEADVIDFVDVMSN
jgi:hypothetical protein